MRSSCTACCPFAVAQKRKAQGPDFVLDQNIARWTKRKIGGQMGSLHSRVPVL
jgi:hypothetical protein